MVFMSESFTKETSLTNQWLRALAKCNSEHENLVYNAKARGVLVRDLAEVDEPYGVRPLDHTPSYLPQDMPRWVAERVRESLPFWVMKSLSDETNMKYSGPVLHLEFVAGTKAMPSHFSFSKPGSWIPPLCSPNRLSWALTLRSRNGQTLAALIPAFNTPAALAMLALNAS